MTHETVSFTGKSILITGGTGSFGQKIVQSILENFKPKRLVIFSRDELKQYEMEQRFSLNDYPCMRYFIGDVRDRDRLFRACANIDIVIHAAAMKHVTAAEYNPTECIATNIMGAINLIDACIENNVERVVALSTDKAANPINLYGATKLCSDKLFVAANNLSGKQQSRFAVVRYGNVIGSRGSVIPFFKRLAAEGATSLPITDDKMTRFVISLDEGVKFVMSSFNRMAGGEIFIPKLPSVKVTDIAEAIMPGAKHEIVGVRPGEKLHETMVPEEEGRNCVDLGDYYVILPTHHWWNMRDLSDHVAKDGTRKDENFEYSSNTNDDWLTNEQLNAMIEASD